MDLKTKIANVQYELSTASGWAKHHNKVACFVEGQLDAMRVGGGGGTAALSCSGMHMWFARAPQCQ